jgi:hypothetical protein
VIAAAVALLLASCSVGWYQPKHPQMQVSGTTCARSLGEFQDVNAPGRRALFGSHLVPVGLRAVGAVLCRYAPSAGHGPEHRTLVAHATIGAADARKLERAARAVDLRKPSGTASCPEADGTVVVIGFRTADHAAVGLWWDASGCQTIDNGVVGASQIGNASFSRFQDVAAGVAGPAVVFGT